MGIVGIDILYTEPIEWLQCPNCNARSPKEGLLDRVKAQALQLGYPFKVDTDYSDDELMRISCDMTKRTEYAPDGKLRLKAE